MNSTTLTAPTVLSFLFFRAAMLLQARRQAEALAPLRELADNAEASRLAELRRQLDETTNTLAAYIGQIEDKLDRLQQRC